MRWLTWLPWASARSGSDCDVIQADGGTRTASITGAFVAMADAMNKLREQGAISRIPITDFIAATSVGRLAGEIMLDLCYQEDSAAEVDMNIVMTGAGRFVEIQGTGEEATFTRQEMDSMINLAAQGISDLISYQKEALGRYCSGYREVIFLKMVLATKNKNKVKEVF